MLMDMFFASLPAGLPKKRVHFHEFMMEVHEGLHEKRGERADESLPKLAEALARDVRVLCFDEFHVTDVADAMILGRLFTALFARGVVVVATSNGPPDLLYEGGLQRERFVPFITLLKERMRIVHLDSPHDYRTHFLAEEGTYFTPLGAAAQAHMDTLFAHLTEGAAAQNSTLRIKSRKITVRAAGGIARFSFAQLCEQPHGAQDYLAIAKTYHTVFLEGVPQLSAEQRNEAKRLMILVDVLYEAGTKLVISADSPAESLYTGHDHAHEFKRTISRLQEMQSSAYLGA
jgi:cell division protein ZapE